jgi:hypothetical protein
MFGRYVQLVCYLAAGGATIADTDLLANLLLLFFILPIPPLQ